MCPRALRKPSAHLRLSYLHLPLSSIHTHLQHHQENVVDAEYNLTCTRSTAISLVMKAYPAGFLAAYTELHAEYTDTLLHDTRHNTAR